MLKFLPWTAAGVLFMAGVIAPIGFLIWIPAFALMVVLIVIGVRSPRFFFAFVSGIGATLVALAVVNHQYIIFLLYGTVVTAGGIVMFTAFGPRTSHAEGPETFPDVD
ncbi:MAG: hypothetical protein IPK93_08015 [Solirubrobacterales bacterium]|nr:hypothetical protein [Solirubrobacterales bacterium]